MVVGGAIGVAVATITVRLLGSLLFAVSPFDPAVYLPFGRRSGEADPLWHIQHCDRFAAAGLYLGISSNSLSMTGTTVIGAFARLFQSAAT